MLEPEYDVAAKALIYDGVKIPLGKVDATAEEALRKEYDVSGYPMLYLMRGDEKWLYDGERSKAGRLGGTWNEMWLYAA